MRHFGIIGFPLEHSFSAQFFNQKFATEGIEAEYSLYSTRVESLKLKVERLLSDLDGFNVTYPYKQAIIPYLDRIDPTAQAIGAVNVVYQRTGYNTDYIGFMESIRPLLHKQDRQALVLGTGGAAKAVCYALRQLGIVPTLVSRHAAEGTLTYDDLDSDIMNRHTVIVNCTPLGMYPDIDTCSPIPYEHLSAQHLLYDCIYNPEETLFLRKGKAQGARTQNGIEMLTGQAKEAWKIWNN